MRIGIFVLLLVAGCNSGVGTQVDVEAGSPVTQDDGTASVPASEEDGIAGIYVGDNACTTSRFFLGELADIDTATAGITRVFSQAGLPIIDGVEVFVGQQDEEQLGVFTAYYTTTHITTSSNGVVLEIDAYQLLDCGNTCQWAFDGVCDEISYCNWGTDCADCGPVRWDQRGTTTYVFLNDGTIQRTSTVVSVEAELGQATSVEDCTAILSK